MNQPLPEYSRFTDPLTILPRDLKLSQELKRYLEGQLQWARTHVREVGNDLHQVHLQINSGVQGVGDDLSSTDPDAPGAPVTLTLTNPIHVVSGTGQIQKIIVEPTRVETPGPTVPSGSFSGPIWLIPSGAWQLITSPPPTGNIALATQATINQVVMLVFNLRTRLWYPAGAGTMGPVTELTLLTDVPIGTPDGVTTTFPSPVNVVIGGNGKPIAQVQVAGGQLTYSTSNPPPPGSWTFDSGNVILAEAPQEGDYFAYTLVAVAA